MAEKMTKQQKRLRTAKNAALNVLAHAPSKKSRAALKAQLSRALKSAGKPAAKKSTAKKPAAKKTAHKKASKSSKKTAKKSTHSVTYRKIYCDPKMNPHIMLVTRKKAAKKVSKKK